MIRIANEAIEPSAYADLYSQGSVERNILDIMSASEIVYKYSSWDQLKFELALRKSIINASTDLYKSRLSFRVFTKSFCNPEFWSRSEEGGFSLEAGVKPSDAIKNIYDQSYKYGTECATAIVILYYKAIVDIYPEELFNKTFPDIYLMNWQHLDSDLGISGRTGKNDLIPGDCRYFKNPDVNPLTPEWQGENVIYLDNDLFYGHGIGIAKSDEIVRALNRHRKPGSEVPAYFMEDFHQRPNFTNLEKIYSKPEERNIKVQSY